MLKLLLPFFASLTTTINAKDEPVNPNKASFDELISIPVIDEATALLIISLRNTKPFENLQDLLERTGLSDIELELLEKYFTFDTYQRKSLSASFERKKDFFKLSSTYNNIEIHLKSQNGTLDQGFIKYKQVSAGSFGLLWDGFRFIPTLSKRKFNFFIETPLEVAIGKNNIAAAGKLSIKSHRISLGALLEKDAHTLLQLGALINLKPIIFNLKFHYPDKKVSYALSYSRKKERINWQLNIRKNTVYAHYYYTKTIPEIMSAIMLRGDGVKNHFAINREWSYGINTFIDIIVTPENIGIYEFRIWDKFLGISYYTGNNEKIRTSINLNPLNINLTVSPEFKNFSIQCACNFKIRQNSLKAGINLNRTQFKLYFNYNA